MYYLISATIKYKGIEIDASYEEDDYGGSFDVIPYCDNEEAHKALGNPYISDCLHYQAAIVLKCEEEKEEYAEYLAEWKNHFEMYKAGDVETVLKESRMFEFTESKHSPGWDDDDQNMNKIMFEKFMNEGMEWEKIPDDLEVD